jgi:MarR-like DNA-binding transcriptional regulator SgrR of sgrS sRNA
LNVTNGDLKNIVTDKPSPLTSHNVNNATKNATGNDTSTGPPVINTSNTTTPAENITITHNGTEITIVNDLVQKKTSATAQKKDDKRVDHTLDGLDVTMGALKGLVSDSTAPLTSHNVKNETKIEVDSSNTTSTTSNDLNASSSTNTTTDTNATRTSDLPLLHHMDVEDAAKGEKINETPKKNVTAWELPAFIS